MCQKFLEDNHLQVNNNSENDIPVTEFAMNYDENYFNTDDSGYFLTKAKNKT